jgi:hypothetical protein
LPDLVRRHGERAEDAGDFGCHLDNPGLEFPLDPGGAGKEDLHRLRQTLRHARRARHEKRTRSARKLSVEEEEGNSAEVIAMEVAHHDDVDGRGVDRCPFQPDERGRSAIHERAKGAGFDEDRRLQTAAAPERIPAADEANVDLAAHSGRSSRGSGRKKLRTKPPKYTRKATTAAA